MKLRSKSLIIAIATILLCITTVLPLCTERAYAEQKPVQTTFFGEVKDDGDGCSVYSILILIVDILSIGVGIVGVVGITIVGIQYLTSGGNDQQAAKARTRMFEIVIGLVAYVLLYSAANFLLPGGKLNQASQCNTGNRESSNQSTS